MSTECKTITYLLGAGASAQCLPIVSKMTKEIKKTKKVLQASVSKYEHHFDAKKTEYIFNLLNYLEDVCKKNYSVDTFAKKCLISESEGVYNELKDCLSLYFTLQQKIKSVDSRYDNFWATVLTDKYTLPSNVRVVSWNYDSQLELSYRDFTGLVSLSEASTQLNIHSHHTDPSLFDANKFSIFKLNGSAKFSIDNFEGIKSDYLIDDFRHAEFTPIYFEKLEKNYYEFITDISNKRKYKNELSFAWEHDMDGRFYKGIKESLKDTSVLVVIGYSFPIYNRKVDERILNECMPKLEKVYLQAPDAEDLKERFSALTTNVPSENITLKKDINQFVFPNELGI